MDMPGSHLSIDKWDRLLSAGRKVWGYANDDAHSSGGIGRGWNVVRVRERTEEAILDALRKGSFYASSGVEINTISADGAKLLVRAPNADAISVFAPYGARILTSPGPELLFDASNVKVPFIRVECHGSMGTAAWSQPIFIHGGEFEALRKRLDGLSSLKPPVLRALLSDRAPKLTGLIDDPLWKRAEPSSRFMRLQDGKKPQVKTEIRAVATATHVFFAVQCEEPDLERMRIKTTSDNYTGAIFVDDSVEFFLDVTGKAEMYFQIAVNAAGVVFSRASSTGEEFKGIVAKTGRCRDGWTIELSVPAAAIGAKVRCGSRWGFHVCRNRPAAGGNFVWSWVGTSNHTPKRFGVLMF
jgi:hypothetical protein